MLNIESVHHHRRAVEAELRTLKAVLRESRQPQLEPDRFDPATKKTVPGTHRRLAEAKRRATALYTLLAHRRRRVHRGGATLEAQADEVAALAASFER
jgi:hypothetical protein